DSVSDSLNIVVCLRVFHFNECQFLFRHRVEAQLLSIFTHTSTSEAYGNVSRLGHVLFVPYSRVCVNCVSTKWAWSRLCSCVFHGLLIMPIYAIIMVVSSTSSSLAFFTNF